MPSSSTQLIIGIAVAIGIAVVSVGPIRSAGTQHPVEVPAQEVLTNRPETQLSETDFRLSDRQQLRIHFLDGHDRLR